MNEDDIEARKAALTRQGGGWLELPDGERVLAPPPSIPTLLYEIRDVMIEIRDAMQRLADYLERSS